MKITKTPGGYKQVFYSLLSLMIITIAGCKKEKQPGQVAGGDNSSTIKYVLNDNFTFSTLYKTLNFVDFQDTLVRTGPYIFLAPENTAFTALTKGQNLIFGDKGPILDMMRYYTIRGRISFKNLPLVQNKAVSTMTGLNIYISKYLNGTDTVTTVNGVKLTTLDNPASNGLIQVLPRLLTAGIYHKSLDYIHNDTTLTLFAAALQRAKLDISVLAGNDEFTILAPSNTAFQQSGKLGKNLGISTLDSILIADPDKLSAFLKYHIVKGRYFEGDVFKYVSANPSGITMFNGGKVVVGGSENTYHSMTFLGNGNTSASKLLPYNISKAFNIYTDIPFDNGVIHVIDQVLIP